MITTLCYLEKDNKYLMLHRTKKQNDINQGKWIGVGGKLEPNETPEQCLYREVKEETGLTLLDFNHRGIVIFNFNDDEPLFMYLYTSKNFSGKLQECSEGDLKWIDKSELFNLNLWEGDKIFLDLLRQDTKFFYLTLNYENDNLLSSDLKFKEDDFVNFEVFVPENFVKNIVSALSKYDLLREGNYNDVYALIDVEGHWTTLEGAKPFDGEVGKESVAREKLMKFRIKKEFADLAYYLIKEAHPYEVPVINILK